MSGARFSTRDAFLVLLAYCYFSSFVSYLAQVEGLYSADAGLVRLAPTAPWWNVVHALSARLNATDDAALQLVCALGSALALLASLLASFRCVLVFALLWLLHVSIVPLGAPFTSFQWDLLLADVGALAMFWPAAVLPSPAPAPARAPALNVVQFSLAFLLFRLMFSSGLVKLLSRGPEWWNLTALQVHYETTCLPHVGSWLFHSLPPALHVASCAIMFWIELWAPWFTFVPTRFLRHVNAASQIALQVMIMLTGNYNYFNLLTIALAVTLIDDSEPAPRPSVVGKIVNVLAIVATIGALVALWMLPSLWSFGTLATHLETALRASLALALFVHLPLAIVSDFRNAFAYAHQASRVAAAAHFARLLCTAVALALLALVSTVPFVARLNRATVFSTIPSPVIEWHSKVASELHVASSYGLFASLTTKRDEILIEGFNRTHSGDGWFKYVLPAQPNDARAAPRFVLPHQPRLDWQMWFASLQGYRHSVWLLTLARRLLTPSSAAVVGTLFDESFDALPAPSKLRITIRQFQLAPWQADTYWTVGPSRLFIDQVPELDARTLERILPADTPAHADKRRATHLSRTARTWLVVSPWLLAVVLLMRTRRTKVKVE
jgi:hypothetical protein